MPSLDCLTVTRPRGGSMPLVALEIWLEVSEGISEDRVELRRPWATMSARRASQSRCSGSEQIASILLVGVDRQHAPGIHGLVEAGAGASFTGQLVGRLEQ